MTVNFTIAEIASGFGEPTGNVTASNGMDSITRAVLVNVVQE